MMPVESSVIKRNVVFHHQIIFDHFQRFSESLKNIFSCILRTLLLHYLLILTLYNRIVCTKKKILFCKTFSNFFKSCLQNGYRFRPIPWKYIIEQYMIGSGVMLCAREVCNCVV